MGERETRFRSPWSLCLLLLGLLFGLPRPEMSLAQAPPAADASSAAPPSAALPDGELPWRLAPGETPAPKPQSAREVLEIFGVGESELRAFLDDEPLGDNDAESLAKLLFRLPQIEGAIHRWRSDTPLSQLNADPAPHKGSVVHLTGVVRKLERRQLIPEVAKLYDFRDFLLVHLECSDSDAVICTRHVPAPWSDRIGEEMAFHAEADAIFLKRSAPAGRPQLVFAAAGLRWLPVAVQPELEIREGQILLARHGMDFGQLVALRKRNNRGFEKEDSRPFYEMLAASHQVAPQELAKAPPADLEKMLTEPEKLHGEWLHLRCTAGDVMKIQITDPEIRKRVGAAHYYQIGVQIPLGPRSVRLGADSDAPEFVNGFPATVCVVELPDEMADVADRLSAGESTREVMAGQLLVDGFFYKLWTYKSQYVRSQQPNHLQPAPLLVASRVRLYDPYQNQSSFWSLVLAVGFLIVLGGIFWSLWRVGRADAAAEKLRRRALSGNRPE